MMENGTTPQALSHILRRPVGQVRPGVLTAWVLAVAVLALIGTVYLAQVSQAAEEGAELESLRFRLGDLQRANAQLVADIALTQAPERLAQRAAELGYRPATIDEIEFISVPDYPGPEPVGTPGEPAGAATTSGSDPLALFWAQLVEALGGGP